MTPQETDSVLPVNVQESLVEAWVGSGLLQGRGSKGGSACMGLLKEVTIIFITSTIIWLQVNNREGTQPHPSIENWIKDLLRMAQPSEQDPASPTVSHSHQEASISLLSLSLRRQTD